MKIIFKSPVNIEKAEQLLEKYDMFPIVWDTADCNEEQAKSVLVAGGDERKIEEFKKLIY